MSNIFIVFKELAITRDEIKLQNKANCKAQWTPTLLLPKNSDTGKFFSNISQKLRSIFHSQNAAFLAFVIFKHCENSPLQTSHNTVPTIHALLPRSNTNLYIGCSIE